MQTSTNQLICMWIGDASDPFIIDMSPNAMIADLKEVIMEKTGMSALPSLVKLFLLSKARRSMAIDGVGGIQDVEATPHGDVVQDQDSRT